MGNVAVFGYASLASAESASQTLGRPVTPALAQLSGWKRRWSQKRDNHSSEKTFQLADGSIPDFVLGLNLERDEDQAGPVNGVLIELTAEELDRLDLREVRYERVEVTDQIAAPSSVPDRVIAYTARAVNLALEPPSGGVILASYLDAVEAAFDALGPGELDRYRATTGSPPADVVAARLVLDQIPAGNPRDW